MKSVALRVCAQRVEELREWDFDKLRRHCGHKLTCEVVGADGRKYAHESVFFWDEERRQGVVRVFVEVYALLDDGWTSGLARGWVYAPADGSIDVGAEPVP